MDAVEILSTLVACYPGLLPWTEYELTPEDKEEAVKELVILLGSWDQVNNHMPPKCGHFICREKWVGTGRRECFPFHRRACSIRVDGNLDDCNCQQKEGS